MNYEAIVLEILGLMSIVFVFYLARKPDKNAVDIKSTNGSSGVARFFTWVIGAFIFIGILLGFISGWQ